MLVELVCFVLGMKLQTQGIFEKRKAAEKFEKQEDINVFPFVRCCRITEVCIISCKSEVYQDQVMCLRKNAYPLRRGSTKHI